MSQTYNAGEIVAMVQRGEMNPNVSCHVGGEGPPRQSMTDEKPLYEANKKCRPCCTHTYAVYDTMIEDSYSKCCCCCTQTEHYNLRRVNNVKESSCCGWCCSSITLERDGNDEDVVISCVDTKEFVKHIKGKTGNFISRR